MEQYSYKKIEQNNLSDVVFLLKKVAGKTYSEAYFRKKYATPRSEGQYHGWLAYEKNSGQVVSIAAALPLWGILPGKGKVPITQMIETFTLPEHRGRGLMTVLAKKIVDAHTAAGTKLFFGLLNQNNVHGFVKKLGFTHTHTMQYFSIGVRTFPLEALCRRLGITGLFRWWATRVINPYLVHSGLAPENSVLAEGYAGVLHDQEFFEYKSFSFNKICEIAGIISWIKLENGLLVGDVSLSAKECTDAQIDEWLRTLRQIARVAGLRRVIFQTWPGSILGQKLSARFPAHDSWAVCCLAGDSDVKPYLDKIRFGFGDFETF